MPKIAYVGGFLPFLDPLHTIKTFSARFPTRLPTALPTAFPARFSHKNFPTRFSHKNFPQDFPTRFSRKIFPQEFPTRFSHKIFPQDFPELDADWLAPHHPIPNAKFPPITALLNRPTYHKRSKVSPPPFPKSYGNPRSMKKLTLNEPAMSPRQITRLIDRLSDIDK